MSATPATPNDAAQPDNTLVSHALTASVGHSENFPVASWLCPPRLRPAVVAIYHFARTADDLADEGDAPASERLAALAAYRQALARCLQDQPAEQGPWQPIFARLREAVQAHQLPGEPLHDLLSAFEQDVGHTAQALSYVSNTQLMDYCSRSANPVGRLLLHLYGVDGAQALQRSDQICTALQLINFWQDLSVDLPRQRHYLPDDVLQRHQLLRGVFLPTAAPDASTQERMSQLVAELCAQARELMLAGAPLVHQIPGRAGWELRLMAQGGLRILDHLHTMGYRSWLQRPRLQASDLPRLVLRAMRM